MLGARIAALRREMGLSQAQLARELQISSSAVGMYEQGRREPSAQMLLALAKLFGVSMEYLVSGVPNAQETEKIAEILASRIASADARLGARAERPFSREELATLFAAMLVE